MTDKLSPLGIRTGVYIRTASGRRIDIGDPDLSAPELLRWLVGLDPNAVKRALEYTRDAMTRAGENS